MQQRTAGAAKKNPYQPVQQIISAHPSQIQTSPAKMAPGQRDAATACQSSMLDKTTQLQRQDAAAQDPLSQAQDE